MSNLMPTGSSGLRRAACAAAMLALPLSGLAASWTRVTNVAPGSAGVMLQMTDGTVMIQRSNGASWMRLSPDATGSYINGVWTTNIAAMSTPRLYFASVMLPSGKLWVLGGEYTGANLDASWSATGEIYDPIANSWSSIASYPAQSGCPQVTQRSPGNIVIGSTIVTAITSTVGFQVGKGVTGSGVPTGTTIASVDSATQIHMSQAATVTANSVPLVFANTQPPACFGDVPAMLMPGGKVFAGNLLNRSSYLYDVASNSWSAKANKFYNDSSDEETWVKLPDGSVLTYDIFRSISTGTGYAEIYDPAVDQWRPVSPADGTASGVLPLLSSNALGSELGGGLRLQDGRIFIIGANGHTALYTPANNSWAAGPDVMGTLNGISSIFGADDAPAAIMPNGHVLLVADAGPSAVNSSGNISAGSTIVTGIPSTALFQVGWAVTGASGSGVQSNTTITSVDSASQIHISLAATSTTNGVALKFGGTFARPTQLFDYNPGSGVIAPVSPAINDVNLSTSPAFITRLLVLPTGQVLFSDSTSQLWVYTPDGPVVASARPVVNSVVYGGGGVFTLTGKQINGQSAGSSYGDDVASDQNYPIVRFAASTGAVYYARTSNWSSTAVGGGSALQSVDFTLPAGMPTGNYSLLLSGAGISSFPVFFSVAPGQAPALPVQAARRAP